MWGINGLKSKTQDCRGVMEEDTEAAGFIPEFQNKQNQWKSTGINGEEGVSWGAETGTLEWGKCLKRKSRWEEQWSDSCVQSVQACKHSVLISCNTYPSFIFKPTLLYIKKKKKKKNPTEVILNKERQSIIMQARKFWNKQHRVAKASIG